MNKLSFKPQIWGKHAWIFLSTIALSYPIKPTPAEKQEYKTFFLSLRNLLPCSTCAEHFTENIKKHNINDYLDHPHSLFSWVVKIENEVNKSLGKSLLDEIVLREQFYNQNSESFFNFSFKTKIILFILLVFFIKFIYMYNI